MKTYKELLIEEVLKRTDKYSKDELNEKPISVLERYVNTL